MNATNILLDKWLKVCSARKGAPCNNTKLAEALGIERTALANYRSGTSQAAPAVVRKLAEAIGEDADHWMAVVESERARSTADRKAWTKVAHRLKSVTMPIMSSGRAWMRRVLTPLARLLPAPSEIPQGA